MNAPVHIHECTSILFISVCYSVLCYCKKVVEGIPVNKPDPDKGTFARICTAEVDVYERGVAWEGGFLK